MVAFAVRVQEGRRPAVVRERPAQDPDVVGLLAGAEDGEQLAVEATELEQSGLAVVPVQGGELPYEVRVVEESGYGVLGQRAQVVAGVQGEDVGHRRLPGDTEGDLATEEEGVSYGDEVARRGRVLGVEAFGAGEFQAGGAELLGAAGVERLRAAGEFGGLCGEAVAQDLVGAGVQAGGHGSLSDSQGVSPELPSPVRQFRTVGGVGPVRPSPGVR